MYHPIRASAESAFAGVTPHNHGPALPKLRYLYPPSKGRGDRRLHQDIERAPGGAAHNPHTNIKQFAYQLMTTPPPAIAPAPTYSSLYLVYPLYAAHRHTNPDLARTILHTSFMIWYTLYFMTAARIIDQLNGEDSSDDMGDGDGGGPGGWGGGGPGGGGGGGGGWGGGGGGWGHGGGGGSGGADDRGGGGGGGGHPHAPTVCDDSSGSEGEAAPTSPQYSQLSEQVDPLPSPADQPAHRPRSPAGGTYSPHPLDGVPPPLPSPLPPRHHTIHAHPWPPPIPHHTP